MMTGQPCRRHAFTLIELLLVVAIISVIAAITVPSFVNSMRGNRLRTSARTVVMMGRYARSMALLKQQEMVVRFDLGTSTLSLHPVRISYVPGTAQSDTDRLLHGASADAADEDEDSESAEDESPLLAGLGDEELNRSLEQVSITFVELEGADGRITDGSCLVRYRSNGTCTPYEVRIEDEHGEAILVKVDMLSSSETERD